MKPIFEKVNYEDNSLIKGFGSYVPVFSSPLHVHPELELVYIERSYGTRCVGESIEDSIIREVKEEVGLDIKNIRYYKSQPWPFSGSMMIGIIADQTVV